MHINDRFTEGERKGVEIYYGTPWDELSDAAKIMRGLVYRHALSPEAIAKMIVGEGNAVRHQGDGEGR
jgi:hypothetical protein